MRRLALPFAVLIAGVTLILGLRIYNDRVRDELNGQLWIPKQTPITPDVALLQSYLRIDTSNPPGRELPGARFLADVLEKNGIRTEIIESEPGRANVYARVKGRQQGSGLLLLNHIDVVPAAREGWTRPPFGAEVVLNQLYGRGTLDMKGIAICELLAMIDIARTHRIPEHDIVFLGTADEERGGGKGLGWLLDHRPDIFAGIRYAINEGGITETTQERIAYFGIEIGTKMTVKTWVRAADRQSLERLRIALEPSITPTDPDRVLPEVREFLHDLAPLRVEQGQYLNDISSTIAAGKFWLLISGYRELVQNVVWPGAIESDGNAGYRMRVNLYNLPDENPDARIEWLRELAARNGVTAIEVVEKSGPAPFSSRHTEMFTLIAAEAQRQYPGCRTGTEVLAASYNDSRSLRRHGIDAYGLMPFPTDWYQTLGIHSNDERVRIDWFIRGVSLMRQITSRYAFRSMSLSD